MRILVVSDSHGNDVGLLRAHEQAGPCDLVIHTGDGEQDAAALEAVLGCTVLRVAGNCDVGSRAERELVLQLSGIRCLITHGDRYGVKSGLERLVQQAEALDVDLILYGHTHHARCDRFGNRLFVNPGALTRQNDTPSYAIVMIEASGVTAALHPLL